MKSWKREGGPDQKNRPLPDNERFGKNMGDLQNVQFHMLWFQCLTQFHSGCEGVVKVRQCQKRRSCMQGQVLLVVPSTFSLTLGPRKVPRHTGECECSFHSGYFVTSPSLCAKMGKHVQPGPAFTQTWSTKRVDSFENGK